MSKPTAEATVRFPNITSLKEAEEAIRILQSQVSTLIANGTEIDNTRKPYEYDDTVLRRGQQLLEEKLNGHGHRPPVVDDRIVSVHRALNSDLTYVTTREMNASYSTIGNPNWIATAAAKNWVFDYNNASGSFATIWIGWVQQTDGISMADIGWYSDDITTSDADTLADQTTQDLSGTWSGRLARLRVFNFYSYLDLETFNTSTNSVYTSPSSMSYVTATRQLTVNKYSPVNAWGTYSIPTSNSITVPVSTDDDVRLGLLKSSGSWELVIGANTNLYYCTIKIGDIKTDSSGGLIELKDLYRDGNIPVPISGLTHTQVIMHNPHRNAAHKLVYTPRTMTYISGTLVKYADGTPIVIDLS